MKTDILDYTDEWFEIGKYKYRLISDVDPKKFTLINTNQSNIPFVCIVKITNTFGDTKQTVFAPYEPLSHFEKPEDRTAIRLAIEFLEKKYQ